MCLLFLRPHHWIGLDHINFGDAQSSSTLRYFTPFIDLLYIKLVLELTCQDYEV